MTHPLPRFPVLLLAPLLLALALPARTLAEDRFETARTAANSGDFETAHRIWTELADRKDDRAEYKLAVLYARGDGVTRDLKRAADWARRAADHGNRDAMLMLAKMYDRGDGVEVDPEKASDWRRRAGGEAPAEERNPAPARQTRPIAKTIDDILSVGPIKLGTSASKYRNLGLEPLAGCSATDRSDRCWLAREMRTPLDVVSFAPRRNEVRFGNMEVRAINPQIASGQVVAIGIEFVPGSGTQDKKTWDDVRLLVAALTKQFGKPRPLGSDLTASKGDFDFENSAMWSGKDVRIRYSFRQFSGGSELTLTSEKAIKGALAKVASSSSREQSDFERKVDSVTF